MRDKDAYISKLDIEIKDSKVKREVIRKEMEDKIKLEESKHEKELTKLRSEITRISAYSKNSFL